MVFGEAETRQRAGMGRAAAGCRSELRTEVVTDSAAGEFSTDDGGLTEEGRCAAQARRWSVLSKSAGWGRRP